MKQLQSPMTLSTSGESMYNYIWTIKNPPDLHLKSSLKVVTLDWVKNTPQEKFLNTLRRRYWAVGTWLEYELLRYTHHHLDLNITDKKHYESVAEISWAYLKLAQEVWPLSEAMRSRTQSPEGWWLRYEREALEHQMVTSGFWGSPVYARGKVAQYSYLVEAVEDNEVNGDPKKFTPVKSKFSYQLVLLDEATRIASTNPWSDFPNHFQKFWEVCKRCERQIRDDKKLHCFYLDKNWNLQVLKGKQPKTTKAFGEEL
jgi:hypothetical protein